MNIAFVQIHNTATSTQYCLGTNNTSVRCNTATHDTQNLPIGHHKGELGYGFQSGDKVHQRLWSTMQLGGEEQPHTIGLLEGVASGAMQQALPIQGVADSVQLLRLPIDKILGWVRVGGEIPG